VRRAGGGWAAALLLAFLAARWLTTAVVTLRAMAWTPWISRRLSGLVGTFDYSGAAFFGADGASEPLVSRRRDALRR